MVSSPHGDTHVNVQEFTRASQLCILGVTYTNNMFMLLLRNYETGNRTETIRNRNRTMLRNRKRCFHNMLW